MSRIGIVGTRTPTAEQRQEIADFVDALPPGTVVISGGARGVDTHAVMLALTPGRTSDQPSNGGLVDTKALSERTVGFALLCRSPYSGHLLYGQFGVVSFRSTLTCSPAFREHVLAVFTPSPFTQVAGSDTASVVAAVHAYRLCPPPMRQEERNSVRSLTLPFKRDRAISTFPKVTTQPHPAAANPGDVRGHGATFVYFRHESLTKRGVHAWTL